MSKDPRRIYVSEERAEEEKKKYHYTELYVYDPDFLDDYKKSIVDVFVGNPELQARVATNMGEIAEFIIADRVKNGLSRLSCSKKQIHMDIQFANIMDDTFSIKPGCEYIETILVHELLHAAARKKVLTGVVDYLRDENGKVIGRKNVGLNEGITQFLAEQITGKPVSGDIDSYAFNKHIVSLLEDTLGHGIMSESYFGEENLLKTGMNLMAGDPEYYDKFNKDLDTINKLQATVRRIKNGSIKPKDSESLARMEVVLAAQQERLAESVFANVVVPAIQKQAKEVRQETLLPLLLKHEELLQPVAKYVVKHRNSDWVSNNILEAIRKEINERGIDFKQIKEASIKIVETKRISAVAANRYMTEVDKFYNENEAELTIDNSNKMTPLLKRQLENMVTVLDQFELASETTKLESAKESLAQYKEFLKKYFHKIPNLEEEIERIREERKNTKKKEEPEEVRAAREAGRKKAEEILSGDNLSKGPTPPEKHDKKEKKHPNLEDNFVVDNITGQIYKQQNKSIYEKAIIITQATGQPLNVEDEVLVELREDALNKFKASLDAKEPDKSLVACYGEKWKEVLIQAYTEGWNKGVNTVIRDATQKGMEARGKTIENLKKGKLPKEKENKLVSLEEVETVHRGIEIQRDKDGNEVVVNRQTGQAILSERTKKIAEFAEEWVRVNGEEAFAQEGEKIYNFIQKEVASNVGIVDIPELVTDAELMSENTKKTVEELFSSVDEPTKITNFFEMQQLNPKKLVGVEEIDEVEQELQVPSKGLTQVIESIDEATFEDIEGHLNLFNQNPIELENGEITPKFNDPIVAARLNARYQELTGQDHPVFVEQAPIVIEGLLKDKEMLLEANAYKPEFFNNLEIIKTDLESRHPELVQPQEEKASHK